MTAKKGGLGRGLGRGLDAMISDTSNTRSTEKVQEKPSHQESDPKDKVFMVKLSQVEPNRKQPRKQFDEDALLELAESIKQFKRKMIIMRSSQASGAGVHRRWQE